MYRAILELAQSEGIAAALLLASDWQRTLEAIIECGTQTEQALVGLLLKEVNDAITVVLARSGTVTVQ